MRDHAGRIVASLSVASPQSRHTGDLETLDVRMLVEAAAEVSARLGFKVEPARVG